MNYHNFRYCVSFSNTDAIIVCNIISGDVKVLKRYTTPMPTPSVANESLEQKKNKVTFKKNENVPFRRKPPIQSSYRNYEKQPALSQAELVANKTAEIKAAAQLKAARANYKDYTDTLIGTYASYEYFLVYSKYFIYVYDKLTRFVKAMKLEVPIIQVEIVENETIKGFGVELEIITRDMAVRDDEEIERDNLVLYYTSVIDPACVKSIKVEGRPTRVKAAEAVVTVDERPTEEEVLKLYVASANRIECHSCVKLTRDKKKLFTMTEIGDNVIECFRNRPTKSTENG